MLSRKRKATSRLETSGEDDISEQTIIDSYFYSIDHEGGLSESPYNNFKRLYFELRSEYIDKGLTHDEKVIMLILFHLQQQQQVINKNHTIKDIIMELSQNYYTEDQSGESDLYFFFNNLQKKNSKNHYYALISQILIGGGICFKVYKVVKYKNISVIGLDFESTMSNIMEEEEEKNLNNTLKRRKKWGGGSFHLFIRYTG